MKKNINNKGVIALTTVIILGAVIAIITLTIAFGGISSRSNTFNLLESEMLFVKADGCMEDALLRLSRDNAFTSGSLTVDDANCSQVINGGTLITVGASEGNYVQNFTTTVQLSPFGIVSFDIN